MITTLSLGSLLRRRFPFSVLSGAALFLVLAAIDSPAAELKEARVSQVIKDVKLLPEQAAPRPAAVSDEVRNGTAVRTGLESRAELTFTDQTLARLGANTIFSFDQGTRNLDLGGGAMLLRVPKNAGGARINTAAITAAITGTTMIIEFHRDAYCKFIMLEGVSRIFRNNRVGESILLHAGQMLIVNPNGEGLPDPVDFDLERLLKTSLLINGFDPLPSGDLIAREVDNQLAKKSAGDLIDTNLVIFGTGTTVALLDPTSSNVLDQANANEIRQPRESPTPSSTPTPTPTITPTPTVSPTPDKFGTPSVIPSSTPYQITGGTVIETDPAITTNGATNFGTIYRGAALDGPASLWFFGATSNFDNMIGFDQNIFLGNRIPIAAFKFSALDLIGNPTIVLGPNGPINLALISVGDLTSGPPGGALTFTGLNFLFLGTENGSITLTSDLSFQNIPALTIYARGAGSVLTFDAAVSGTSTLGLFSEGNIEATNSLVVTETSGTGQTSGLILSLLAGQAITIGQDLTLTLDAGTGAPAGALLNLLSGGDLTVNGAGGLTLTIASNAGRHLAGEASLGVSAGGNLTANALNLLINNRDGGAIDGAATLTLGIGGALTIAGDAVVAISNRDDGGGGGTMGGPATLILNAGSISIGGLLDTGITPPPGPGSIPSVAMAYNVAGGFTVGGSADFELANGGTGPAGFRGGGLISGDASLNLNAGFLSIGDFFNVSLANLGGGQIGGDASISINTSNGLTAVGQTIFQLANGGGRTFTSGSIGGSALLTLNTGNISINNFFGVEINNESGSITGDAILSASVGGLATTGDTLFDLLNGVSFNVGGTIGGDATISIAAQSLSAANLIVQINNLGGTIGGDSRLIFATSGAVTTTGDATFEILQNGPTGTSFVTVTVGSFSIGGSLIARIGDSASSFDIGNVAVNASKDITAGGTISVDGNVTAGGNISGAGGIFTPGNPSVVNAGGSVFAPGIITGALLAGNGITIDNTAGSFSFGIIANTISAGGTLRLINSPTLSPNNASSDGTIGFTPVDFTLTAASIVSSGPTFPFLFSDGSDADPNFGNNNPGNGGKVTLNLTGGGLTIGSSNDLTGIEANGGAFALASTAGGNGGTVNITASGDVRLLDGDITATSGLTPSGTPSGNGGTVNVTTSGAITVDSTIEVSSDEIRTNPPRLSATGGNINLTSTKATSGAAITVSNSGQLLALLDQAAPGPGGKITILASGGGGSSVNLHGTAIADRGTVDVRHTGANGAVNLGDATNPALLRGDLVKAGALGNNGVLTIGQGTISANNVLKLYAASANGTIHFIADSTIGGGNFTILAANTVTLDNGVTVNVSGATADVYVGFNGQGIPNANYNATQGGNGSTNGVFGGAGVNSPQPIGNAPPFDGPPGG